MKNKLRKVIFSSNQTASVNTFIIVLQSLVISFILVIWCDSEDKLQAAFKILAICSLIFCIRVVLHIDLARFGTRKIGYIMGLNANTIGLRCALCFLICLFLVTTSKGLFNKTFYSLVLIVNFAIIMATGSRRALIIIILCSFIYLYKKTQGSVAVIKVFLFSISSIVIVYLLMTKIEALNNIIGHRLETFISALFTSDESALGAHRDQMISCALELFTQSPVLGWGMGTFRYVSGIDNIYAHNNYVELLFATGICGFLTFYYIYIYIIRRLDVFGKRCNPVQALMIAYVAALLISDIASPSYSSLYIYIFISFMLIFINMNGKQSFWENEDSIREEKT